MQADKNTLMDADSSTSAGADSELSGRRVSRRGFLGVVAAAGVAMGMGGMEVAMSGEAQPSARFGHTLKTQPEREALAFVNGRIHTLDESNPVVSSVVIRNGRFAQVGGHVSERDVRVVNLHGRTVVPGIIDSHNHIVLMAMRPGYHTPLENARSIRDIQKTLTARRKDVPSGQFITTIGGFHTNMFAERRLPTLAELDQAVSDRPVFIQLSFTGPSTTNSRGKAFFESKGIPVGADGLIAAAPFGTPGPTTQALLELRRLQTFEDRKRSALDAMAYAASLGVTTHLDQGASEATGTAVDNAGSENLFTQYDPFLELHAEGKMSIRLRINFIGGQNDPTLDRLRARLAYTFPFFGDDIIRTGGIGEWTADNLTLGSALWLEGTKLVAQAGWRNENHSLTRTDFQTVIQGWETVNAEASITDLRWVLAHCMFLTRDYVDRLKALGGGVNLSGARYLSATPTNNGPPFRMIVDSGIPVGMSSDGMQAAPMNPWLHAYYATTGKNALGELINAGQQISRQELLNLYTRSNAWFIGEDDLGSIEVGKHADLVVLNDDYFRVPEEGLKNIRSVLTVLGGRVVYDAGVLSRGH